jgi:hypothetical protein
MLDRSKTLADFVGKNDKTKIVVQCTKKGAGVTPPPNPTQPQARVTVPALPPTANPLVPQRAGGGWPVLTLTPLEAPVRESQNQSKSEQEAMMAYYFKKKEVPSPSRSPLT